MANVRHISPAVAGPSPAEASYRNIRLASRGLAILFTIALAGYAVFVGALALAFVIPYAGNVVAIGPVGMLIGASRLPAGYVAVGGLPLVQRLAHVLAGFVVFTPGLLIFWNLRQLFGLYGRSVVFGRENATHIKWIGAALAADAAAPFIVHTFLTATGLAIDHNWLHVYSFQELVLGAIVYVIAQVMEVGREIEEERGQFV